MEGSGKNYYWSSSGPVIESLLHSSYIPMSGWSLLTSWYWSAAPDHGKRDPRSGAGHGLGISAYKQTLISNTVSLNLTQFKGREPFTIKTAQGEPVTEIQPGSPLAFLHLNRQSAALRQLSPFERIQTMTRDLQETFSLIDSDQILAGLNPKQQAVLTAARSAVIVGISHLVPIFRRRTGLPFWKLDVLPEAIQQLHRLDSQAVSNQFGGHRQVKVEDVEMMVITPQMRQQLATVYA